MPYRRLIALTAALTLALALPAAAGHRHNARVQGWLHAGNLYAHNFGPGPWPDSFAYYDGPTRALCKQGAAAYRGQDGRRHPCS